LTEAAPGILARIVTRKMEELASPRFPMDAMRKQAREMAANRRDFRAALRRRAPAIIAEMKKASPSRGVLATDFDPATRARDYQRGGAAALSVLTDETFFQGSLADLSAARAAVELPVLRKDFTLDEYQVVEAAAHGADAILLIVAILDQGRIRALRAVAEKYGMAALVEVHDDGELDIALAAGADVIGVNNRDLRTFAVDLETSIRLARRIPAGVLKIAESGIHSAADVARLAGAGFDAFLVGEHLMQSADPAAAIGALAGRS
jgi:indole-3-glycerol phosphate synthase